MGFLDGKISFLMILASCVFAVFLLLPNAAAENDETSVILKVFKLPEYNKDTGALDYIVYGQEANNVGVIVNLKQLKVDWIGKDIKDVKGTVTTPSGIYDRSTKIIRGDEEVHFRSDAMNVDGVGFDADQKKQTIHIRSKVKVILRGNLMTDKENEAIMTQDKEGKK